MPSEARMLRRLFYALKIRKKQEKKVFCLFNCPFALCKKAGVCI